MRRIDQVALAAAAGVVVASAAAVASPPRLAAAPVVAAAAAATTQPCIPNPPTPVPGTNNVPLPTPPVHDTTQPGQSRFTVYVSMNPDQKHFCYTTAPNSPVSYVEAPTIVVARGGTFTMTLVNRIPPGPSPLPTPPQRTGNVDGCAWLPYEGSSLPTPDPAKPAVGYFNHPRAEHPGMPPWMAPNDTNFHTHGWHVDPYVDNVFKSLVYAPNPNTCVFTFKVPTTQPPGTYWYHSHMHGISSTQVGGGLAGTLIVVPDAPALRSVLLVVKNAPGPQVPAAPHAPMAMNDAMGGMQSQDAIVRHYQRVFSRAPKNVPAASASPVPFDPFNPRPWYASAPVSGPYCPPVVNVTDGGALAVNGALIPVIYKGRRTPAAGPAVSQFANTTVRYRILNAAANAYVNLKTMSGNTAVPLNVVGRDGVPVNWDPATSRIDPSKPAVIVEPNVFVPPSGRVDIVVTMRGAPLRIISAEGTPTPTGAPPTNTPFCMGYDGFPMPEREILTINPAFETAAHRAPLAMAAAPKPMHAPTIAGAFAKAQLQLGVPRRAITFTQYPAPGGPPEWYVTETGPLTMGGTVVANPSFTERPFFLAPAQPSDPKYPYVPTVRVHQNSVEEWYLFNASPEVHAFHIHQLTFVAVESPFEATDPYRQVFLDTVALPAGKLINAPEGVQLIRPSVTKVVIDFHRVDPGVFVFHCHMLFHEDHGMMGIIEVLPSNVPL